METRDKSSQAGPIPHLTGQCMHHLLEAGAVAFLLPQDDADWAETQLARLRLWADSLGVFASGLWSIEHRLRSNTEVRSLILQLLAAIDADLRKWTRSRLEPSQPPSTQSYESEESDDSSASQLERPTRRRVEADIGRLIRFAVQIRKARTSLTDQRVARHDPLDSEGVPIVNEFLDHIRYMIHSVMPLSRHTSHLLKERLLNTMTLRWRRLMLQRQHAENLADATPEVQAPITSSTLTFGSSGAVPPPNQTAKSTGPQKSSEGKSSIGATTTAGSFKITAASHGKASSSGTLALKDGNDTRHLCFPKPPKTSMMNEVECPFCHIPLAKVDLVRTRWENHVMHDLRPYVCLYEECPKPDCTYRNSDAWLTHFRRDHGSPSWECQICRRSFHEAAQIIAHTRTEHHIELSAAQADTLATTTRVQTPVRLHDCPFCQPGSFTQTDLANAEGQQFLLDHISKTHLMPLALMSIPFDFGDNDSDKATRASQEFHQAIRELPQGVPSSNAESIDQMVMETSQHDDESTTLSDDGSTSPSGDQSTSLQRLDRATMERWKVMMDNSDALRDRYLDNLGQAEPLESETYAEDPAPSPTIESPTRAEQTTSLSERRYLDKSRNKYFIYDGARDILVYEDGMSLPCSDGMRRSILDSSTVPRSVAPFMQRASSSTTRTPAVPQSKLTRLPTSSKNPQLSSSDDQDRASAHTHGTTPMPRGPAADLYWSSSRPQNPGSLATQWQWDPVRAKYYVLDLSTNEIVWQDGSRQPRSGGNAPQPVTYRPPSGLPSGYPTSYTTVQEDLTDRNSEDGLFSRVGAMALNEHGDASSVRRTPSQSGGYIAAPSHARVDIADGMRLVSAKNEGGVQTRFLTEPPEKTTDPALLQRGIRAQRRLLGTPGSEETMNPEYRVKKDSFFRVGRVFKVLWAEPAGESGTVVTSYEPTQTINTGRHGERIFSKVRRFVVVRAGNRYCTALPILSYGGQGVAKPGVNKSDHGIIYTGTQAPEPLARELPQRSEQPMRSHAIRVIPDDPRDLLDPLSRVNYGKVTTVEHNLKVKSVGMVLEAHVQPLVTQFHNVVLGNRTAVASAVGPSRPRSSTAESAISGGSKGRSLPSVEEGADDNDEDDDDDEDEMSVEARHTAIARQLTDAGLSADSAATEASMGLRTQHQYQRYRERGYSQEQAMRVLAGELQQAAGVSREAALERLRSRLSYGT